MIPSILPPNVRVAASEAHVDAVRRCGLCSTCLAASAARRGKLIATKRTNAPGEVSAQRAKASQEVEGGESLAQAPPRVRRSGRFLADSPTRGINAPSDLAYYQGVRLRGRIVCTCAAPGHARRAGR